MVLAKGSKLLALTVPECAMRMGWLDDARDELNQMILAHQAPRFNAFDLRAHIPYHSLTEDEQADRWDDGLHLTPEGYNWMGNHIADALISLLQRNQDTLKARSLSKQEELPEEELQIFEEEDGTSKDIRSGYVVVRKRDLD